MVDENLAPVQCASGEQKQDLNALARYYHSKLTGETKAYFIQRGLNEATIETYQLGYDDGVRFGFIENVGALGDYFRDRYVLPIMDVAGQVVNMVGRSIGTDQPLYKNLPANLVVNADVLFNEGAIQKGDAIFLCEGIIDALSLIQANFPAVAIMGPNSFKPEWAEKFTGKHVFICFDNDEVGRLGRDAVAQAISEKAANVYFINLPEDIKDVNEFFIRAKDAPQNFALLVNQAIEWGKYRQFPADVRNQNVFFQEYVRRNERKMVGVPTGFTALDELLFGGLLGGLYLVAGKPAVGKTTFLKNMADHLTGKKIPVIFVSLEMSAFELWAKSISRLAGVPVRDIFAGVVDLEAVKAAHQEYSKLAPYTWTVEGTGAVTAAAIDSYVYQTVNELGGAPVVIIDYLQRIPIQTNGQIISQEMSDSINALALKRLTQKYGCPVVVATSLESAGSAPLHIHSKIAAMHTADVVLYLSEVAGEEALNGEKHPVSVEIIKNRNGVLGSLKLNFNKAHSVFEPVE